MWGKGAAQREQRFVTLNSVVRDIRSSCARCSAAGVWQVWWAEPIAPTPAKQSISNLLIYRSSKENLGMGGISNNFWTLFLKTIICDCFSAIDFLPIFCKSLFWSLLGLLNVLSGEKEFSFKWDPSGFVWKSDPASVKLKIDNHLKRKSTWSV